MFQILYYLVEAIQPILAPLCFLFAWTFIVILLSTLFSAARDTAARVQQMHQIPCTNCQFFTNDYRLKCTVRPHIANTEAAIDCSDYRPE